MKRDLIGYGGAPIEGTWPNDSKVAVNFVINYEEGAELSPCVGDAVAERYGGEFPLVEKPQGTRHLSMESLFEYGSRAGIWRLLRLFSTNKLPITLFTSGLALQLNPKLVDYIRSQPYDIAGHGWRWIDYATLSEKEEKKHIERCTQEIQSLTGQRIEGWYTGRQSENTRQLLKDIGGFVYDSDSYADDLPYFEDGHLIIPYTLVCNDFRYCTSPGFHAPDDFYQLLCHNLDYLIDENRLTLMTIGLHSRISGHPGRCYALQAFINHLEKKRSHVWVARRIDIAKHWANV